MYSNRIINPIAFKVSQFHLCFNFDFYRFAALKDSYDELQASSIAKGIERGRLLLTESPSLASELDGLTHDDVSTVLYTTNGYSYLEFFF